MIEVVDGIAFNKMLFAGTSMLSNDFERINALNVFPVPDGDTGTNMKMTIEGGINAVNSLEENNLSIYLKALSRALVLNARGNSGVILSQFFKGLSLGCECESVDAKGFAELMISGYKRAYAVVSNPTEGTILTVMREAAENTYNKINEISNINQYLEVFLDEARASLDNTPNLLPILKKANVIDSGGAGFILIIEGMLKYCNGDKIIYTKAKNESKNMILGTTFNADSILTYGYCTEFILQLQNSKVDPKTFDVEIINSYLANIGNSIVSFKDEDIIKVHVHTFDPGQVLTHCRKYGEYLSVKIENMNVSHTEGEALNMNADVEEKEFKKCATVVVCNGSGLAQAFKEMGVDQVISGGQTMNTSTKDFIQAFEKINAENILVYPNNSNIIMAAQQAKEAYTKANIHVIPTKTIAEGYSAVSMLYDCDDINELLEAQKESFSNVSTLEITYAIRNAQIDGIDVKKGDYICLYNGQLIAANKKRLEALKNAFKAITDFADKQVLTILCGNDVDVAEATEVTKYAKALNKFIESYVVSGNQDIYSYIIGIE